MSHSGSVDDFLRNHKNREPWEKPVDEPMDVDEDGPTGWGALPWAPTDKDRASNAFWDSLYGDWRKDHWEEVEYTDGYQQKKSRNN